MARGEKREKKERGDEKQDSVFVARVSIDREMHTRRERQSSQWVRCDVPNHVP
jgi:hypothetical protein